MQDEQRNTSLSEQPLLSDLLKVLMTTHRLKISHLAELTGLSQENIKTWRRGTRPSDWKPLVLIAMCCDQDKHTTDTLLQAGDHPPLDLCPLADMKRYIRHLPYVSDGKRNDLLNTFERWKRKIDEKQAGTLPLYQHLISYLYDVTYPDDTMVQPNELISRKGWRIYNGTAETLDPSVYELRKPPITGHPNQMLGAGGYPLVAPIPPSSDATIYISSFRAPSHPGCYRATYQVYHRPTHMFVGDLLWIQVMVRTPNRDLSDDDAVLFLGHGGINHGTHLPPNATFTKQWRLYNGGATVFHDYRARRIQGTIGPEVIDLPYVSPHQPFILRAPIHTTDIPGEYSAIYQLETADGRAFGDPIDLLVYVQSKS